MPNIDHHAAVSTLRARYNVTRRVLESQDAETARLAALDAIQAALESLSPSTLSCTAWQDMAWTCFNTAFCRGACAARRLYAGGLLVFGYSTGITWSGEWHGELLDA